MDAPKRDQKRKRNGQFGSGIRVRGFFRVNLVEHDEVDGAPRIVGDSGWVENQITTVGKAQYLALALGSLAGSKYIRNMALGSGTAPASNHTNLHGEFADMTNAGSSTRNRMSVTPTTGSGAGEIITVQFAATWASSNTFVTTTHVLANIGLHWTEHASSTFVPGSLFAGTTFGTSALNTNQDVQALNSLPLAA